MGKTIINMDLMQKNSSATYVMEPTARKVLSRYLRGQTGSCHDTCKHGTKPINHFPIRCPDKTRANVANSVQTIKKVPPAIPKPMKNNNNNVFKDDVLKKEILKSSIKKDKPIELKRQDLKPKPENSSRTPNRRHSDIFVPNNDMSLPSARIPKRRLSEIIPNRNVGSVLNMSPVGGFSGTKNESRKDLKLSLVNKKSSSVKTTVSNPKTSVKAPILRTQNSLQKPELKEGSRKSKPAKPIEEFVPEKTLYVVELKNGEETTKIESPISPVSSTSSGEKVMRHDHNGLQVSSSSMGDDTHVTEGQNIDNLADSGAKNTLQVSSSSMEDDTHVTDGQNNDILADSGAKNTLQVSSSSMEDDTHVTDGQNNDNLADSGVKNSEKATIVVETRDSSPEKLKFSRGKVLDPQSESSSPRKLHFREGKVLDKNETKADNNKSLRRVNSDGVVRVPESHSVSVELKHQEMEEKKDLSGLINNVIEETASKLIQTRKSKVKALVGAFENVFSSGNDRKILDSRSTKLL